MLKRCRKLQPNDPYVAQQLALATYKSKSPDTLQSLQKARAILEALCSRHVERSRRRSACGAPSTSDCGRSGRTPPTSTLSIRAYARGYFIKNDYYNGINFAFLLNVRAALSQGDEAIADRVLARRTREAVVTLCDLAADTGELAKLDRVAGTDDDVFWANASKVEALLGLGQKAASDALKATDDRLPAPSRLSG